jgi:pimeloyl-ACP methyl ester carboxylesterase
MTLIHHVDTGNGHPPIVFVHVFACAHSDWEAQVAHLSPDHQTVAVDPRGHGASPGTADECSIERYGTDVAEVLHTLGLTPAVLVGHSMGCRVVIEAALQAPAHTAAVVLVDGSQFAPGMEATLNETFATPDGYSRLTNRWFEEMFTTNSDPAVAAAVVERATALLRPIGEKMLTDLIRYDVGRFSTSLTDLRVPRDGDPERNASGVRWRRGRRRPTWACSVLAFHRCALRSSPTLEQFPQIDEPSQINALLDDFITTVRSPR